MDNDAVALRPRLVLAIVTVAAVAFAELGIFFCFDVRLVITGLVTVLVLLLLARILLDPSAHGAGAGGRPPVLTRFSVELEVRCGWCQTTRRS